MAGKYQIFCTLCTLWPFLAFGAECHGFVCDSPDEAILVAANLYQERFSKPNQSSRHFACIPRRLCDQSANQGKRSWLILCDLLRQVVCSAIFGMVDELNEKKLFLIFLNICFFNIEKNTGCIRFKKKHFFALSDSKKRFWQGLLLCHSKKN
jgi:hypothetical protein